MKSIDAWPALRRAAGCGPFFDLVRWDYGGPPAVEPARLGWLPMTDFAEHPLGLSSRVNSVRDSLLARGFADPRASSAQVLRVSASVAFLGVAARLLSPVVGSAVTAGVTPDLSWQGLHWHPAEVGTLPLAIGPVLGQPLCPAGGGSADQDARTILGSAVARVLRLGDALTDRFLVPPKIVAGNVASAVVGAAAVANRHQPVAAGAARGLIAGLLADGELAGTGAFVDPTDGDAGSRFRRRSCCQLYRVHGAALCGDCVLLDRPGAPAG